MYNIINNGMEYYFKEESELLKYLMKLDNYDNLESDSNEIVCLIKFLSFYKNEKRLFSMNIARINDSFNENGDNNIIKEFIDEFKRMNSDGKYVRAALISLGYLCNKDEYDDSYLELAIAYETFQTAILIHDDIIDNSNIRRGKKTIPFVYRERFNDFDKKSLDFEQKKNHTANSIGICSGDLGFFLTNKLIINKYYDLPNFKELLNLYNDIVIKTIKGEVIDVILPFNSQYSSNIAKEEDVMQIYKLKTSWYTIIGPFLLGMTLSNCNKENLKIMEDSLMNLGIAFQIKDDILGIFGSSKELGKSNTSDISEFKQTILFTYISEHKKEYLEDLLKIYGKENVSDNELEKIKNIFVDSGALNYANEIMTRMFKETISKIDEITFINEEYKSILKGFTTYLNLRNN